MTPAQNALDGVLDEIEDYLEQRQDITTRDNDGRPRPNEAMSLLADLRWWRACAKRSTLQTTEGEKTMSNVERNDVIEDCAQICEAQGRASPALDGQTFYIATGQCATALRKMKVSPDSTGDGVRD